MPPASSNHTHLLHHLPLLPTMHPSTPSASAYSPVVVASLAEAEYAAAFGGGQVLVELTLTLTNLGHPQQSPPLLFVDNECAIGLATSSVRPKKFKSIDMNLDWLKEWASQQFLRLVFLSGLINPADFFTKILPVYHHIGALPFLHGTVYCPQPPHTSTHPTSTTIQPPHVRSSRRNAARDRDPPSLPPPPSSSGFTSKLALILSHSLASNPLFSPAFLNKEPDAPAHLGPTATPWIHTVYFLVLPWPLLFA
jgi:hypothetical protein